MRTEPLPGYWRDLGRPGAYLNGHRDLIAGKVDVFDHPGYPIISHWDDRPAARLRAGCHVEDSLVSAGADIAGEVVRSVLGPGVVVEAGAQVEDCVLWADVRVERGAHVTTTIADDRTVFARDCVVGEVPTSPGRPRRGGHARRPRHRRTAAGSTSPPAPGWSRGPRPEATTNTPKG